MSTTYNDSNRQVVPRWYTLRIACLMGDLTPAGVTGMPKFQSPERYQKKIQDWRNKQTLPHAVDLVGTALITGDFDNKYVKKAASFIATSGEDTGFGREIAELYLGGNQLNSKSSIQQDSDILHHRVEIARLKNMTRKYPRNAIGWADLAFHYTLLGQLEKAQYCINLAVSMGGDNRFILRAATRCFLHLGNPEQSLFYLRRSGLSKVDPWIASAEIAVSEALEIKPHLLKPARSMMKDGNLSPWSLNELSATLSTLEARDGSVRKSRKLLAKALREPNENTIAQAEWLAPSLKQKIVRPKKAIRAPFEADARLAFRDGDYNKALNSAKEWFRFQPFTSRPAILASYIASVCLEDYQAAIDITEEALLSSPDSFLLHNNQAFALASLNKTAEAEQRLSTLRQANIPDDEHNTLLATRGLIEFRKGNIVEGRSLYETAISALKNRKEFRSAALATFFWAREEAIVHSQFEAKAMREAKDLAEQHDVKELLTQAKSLATKG